MTTAKAPPLFHLAIPVDDLAAADAFYGALMGCAKGRRTAEWTDYNFFGHQLVTHLSAEAGHQNTNKVDGEDVPVRHFGVILDHEDWRSLADRMLAAGADFIIPPTLRHKGQPGEQHIFFVRDPAGNALEFKSFRNPDDVFAV